MYKMSKHASIERYERLAYLVDTVGIGEELCRVYREESKVEILTDTGVILVIGIDNTLITAYLANLNKAFSIWRGSTIGARQMPQWLYKRLLSNRQYYNHSIEIDDLFGYHKCSEKYRFF